MLVLSRTYLLMIQHYDSGSNWESLVSNFRRKLEPFLEWVKLNQISINWQKTKLMVVTNKRIKSPSSLIFGGNNVEVVTSFKLLRILIDYKLLFDEHFETLKKNVNTKLFSIKRIFYLSIDVRTHFFKIFIQPCFDYCFSIFIYYSDSLLNSIERFYDLFRLLKFKLFGLDWTE